MVRGGVGVMLVVGRATRARMGRGPREAYLALPATVTPAMFALLPSLLQISV